jgi:hypothetical protein
VSLDFGLESSERQIINSRRTIKGAAKARNEPLDCTHS